MKCIINGKTYEGTPKACFDAMALAHKLDLEKAKRELDDEKEKQAPLLKRKEEYIRIDHLLFEAIAEKERLITQLREMLELASSQELMESEATEADHAMELLKKVPNKIYTG